MRITVFLTVLAFAVTPAQGADYRAPRDAFGRPSFEGLWTNNTATPLERPAQFKDQPTTSEKTADAYAAEASHAYIFNGDPVGARESEWFEKGTRMLRIDGAFRTSMIVEPENGLLPYTDEARRRLAAANAGTLTAFDGPESRAAPDRCLAGNSGSTGAPMLPANFTNNYQLVQTRDMVAIGAETLHDVRLIPLGERRAAPSSPRRWSGNSVGWFEGETLVVETAGFHPGESYKPSVGPYISADARVTERFTRRSASEILYEFTVVDPATYVRPWKARLVLTAIGGPLFEYACHEGNYALEGMLAGARQSEDRARRAGR
jgi:hypothetical protein